MKKIIWYLHHYAGAPSLGMSYRPYYLAKEFQALAAKPFVIAASFHHLLNNKPKVTSQIQAEIIEDVPYIWVKTNTYAGNGIGRLINMFSYALKIRLFAKKIVEITEKPDVIIVSSSHPLHYFSGRMLAKKYNARLIFEVRDIWPLSLIEILGVAKFNPLVLLMNWIEKRAYHEADFVVSLLPNALAHMQPKGLPPERFVYIPNGVSSDPQKKLQERLGDSSASPQDDSRNGKYDNRGGQKFIIGYIGAHGVPNALDQFISAMAILQEQGETNIQAVLVGKGITKTSLQEQAKNLKNISFLDPIPKDQVPEFLARMDGFFIGWKALPIYKYGISPNKIFDYMFAEKPIVHAVDTPFDPVQLAKCGITVPPEQPKELAKAIKTLANLPLAERVQMGLNGKKFIDEHHRYEVLAKKYLTLFG